MAQPNSQKYKLIYTVPPSHLQITKDAIFGAGAGVYSDGKYVQVAFQTKGQGQFVCGPGSNPYIGTPGGELKTVDEYRVETTCESKETTRKVVEALKM